MYLQNYLYKKFLCIKINKYASRSHFCLLFNVTKYGTVQCNYMFSVSAVSAQTVPGKWQRVLTLAGSSADVGDKPSTAGLGLSGALLTRMTPGSANSGTAQRLGANNSTHLTLAHVVDYLGEARTCSIICE